MSQQLQGAENRWKFTRGLANICLLYKTHATPPFVHIVLAMENATNSCSQPHYK